MVCAPGVRCYTATATTVLNDRSGEGVKLEDRPPPRPPPGRGCAGVACARMMVTPALRGALRLGISPLAGGRLRGGERRVVVRLGRDLVDVFGVLDRAVSAADEHGAGVETGER